MNLVAPFGFYGCGNIGDEATLQGFARLVREHGGSIKVQVASQNPRHTAQVEPQFGYYRYDAAGRSPLGRWARYSSRGYVIPGGTPIMDGLGAWPLCELVPLVSAAHRRGKPVAFVGAGTESLDRQDSRRLVAEKLAPQVVHWSVRSERDRQRLVTYDVPHHRITVAADMAWLLPRVSADFGQRVLGAHGLDDARVVAVNVNSERAVLAREPRLVEKLAALLDRLADAHDVRILFLCNEVRAGETFDKATAERILSLMKRKDRARLLLPVYWSPHEMMSVIASCSLALSTRYHFCLFAALQDVPFVAIKRSDKVTDLCADLSWPFGAVPGAIEVAALEEQITDLLDPRRSTGYLGPLRDRVDLMRERAWRNRFPLQELIARAAETVRGRSLAAVLRS